MKKWFVYILTNKSNKVLYIWVTNDIVRRTYEHKTNENFWFTAMYNVHKLVYFEEHDSISDAITREKQLKRRNRQRKIDLIKRDNPERNDLYEDIN